MKSLSEEEVGELRALLEKATRRPWELLPETFSPRIFIVRHDRTADDPAVGSILSRYDAAVIAAAVNKLPAILAELDTARTERGNERAMRITAAEERGDLAAQLNRAERERDALLSENTAQARRIADLEAVTWRPIETAPKDGEPTLVAHFQGMKRDWVQLATFKNIEGNKHWYVFKGGGCYPTHWIPLPGPPLTKPTQGEA